LQHLQQRNTCSRLALPWLFPGQPFKTSGTSIACRLKQAFFVQWTAWLPGIMTSGLQGSVKKPCHVDAKNLYFSYHLSLFVDFTDFIRAM
jgi:hypothetical protein